MLASLMPASPFIDRLHSSRPLLGDGEAGLPSLPEGFSGIGPLIALHETAPEIVRARHAAYLAAGADLLSTLTADGNAVALYRHRLDHRIYPWNRAAAEQAREAAGDGAYVLGRLGPLGERLQPEGEIGFEEARDAFGRQAAALLDGGVDGFLIEAAGLAELQASALGVRDLTDLPVLTALRFRREAKGFRTLEGDGVADVIRVLPKMGVEAVGPRMAGSAPELAPLLAELKQSANLPLAALLEGGRAVIENGRSVLRPHAEATVAEARACLEAGASLLFLGAAGEPEIVRALRQELDHGYGG